jgi:hypothetical protein
MTAERGGDAGDGGDVGVGAVAKREMRPGFVASMLIQDETPEARKGSAVKAKYFESLASLPGVGHDFTEQLW